MSLTWPAHETQLLPFAPLVYVAWADGVLDAKSLGEIRGGLLAVDGLSDADRAQLSAWLDPASPPDSGCLQQLLKVIRQHAGSLSNGEDVDLWSVAGNAGAVNDATRSAILEMQGLLGVAGREASRELVAPLTRPGVVDDAAKPGQDCSSIREWLDAPFDDVRNRVRRLLDDPDFYYRFGQSKEEQRERVFRWVKAIADEGFGALGMPEQYGGAGDFGAFIAAFETLGYHDTSTVIKYGVQFGLFGGSVMFLGTKHHHEKYLKAIGRLELPGCFAMTELGHGSNVWDIETTATYDADTDEIVVHTPTPTARKEWIGNAALHGRMATVFAQLQVGDEHFGVHAILVPIRHASGEFCEGVTIEDCGEKEGLNGVDNGRLWFNQVRVPRANLLDRYGSIADDGTYQSPIASPHARFFTMLGTLGGWTNQHCGRRAKCGQGWADYRDSVQPVGGGNLGRPVRMKYTCWTIKQCNDA